MVKHDDYMTLFSAWKDVSPYIPRHLTLWEAFYDNGTSGDHLTELGFDVIHEDVDFFTHDLGEYVVTNPPFSARSPESSRAWVSLANLSS